MARFTVKPEKADECTQAITEFVDEVLKNEPGTREYTSYTEEDGISFVHFMVFEDDEAKKIHENSEYVKKFVSVLYPNCAKEPVFNVLKKIA